MRVLIWLRYWVMRCATTLGEALHPHAGAPSVPAPGPKPAPLPPQIPLADLAAGRGPGPGHPERVEPHRPPSAVERALWALARSDEPGPRRGEPGNIPL